MLVRRARRDHKLDYYWCFAPPPAPLAVLVYIAGMRRRIEEAFQPARVCAAWTSTSCAAGAAGTAGSPAMLAYAFLVIAALAERTRHPAPPGLAPMTRNEVAHVFATGVIQPVVGWPCEYAGRGGGDDTRPAPKPATTRHATTHP